MLGNDVFIAFSNKKVVETLIKIANRGGFNIAGAVLTAAELKEKLIYYESGIVVCGCRFGDEDINSLIDDIPESFNILLLGSPEQLSFCDNARATKLAVPINAADMLAYLDMLRPEVITRRSKRSPEEQRVIDDAKRILIAKHGMTEPQAHRFLEKSAMNTGRSIIDTAKKIIGAKR